MRPAHFTANIIDISFYTVSVFKIFARNTLITAKICLCLTKVDSCITKFNTLNDAGNNLSNAISILIVLTLTLGFADFLKDNLFCSLSRNTSVIHRRQFFNQNITKARIRLFTLCLLYSDLRRFVFNFFWVSYSSEAF